MYLIGDQPPYAAKLISTLQGIPTQLLDGLEPCAEPMALDAVEDLYQVISNRNLYLLRSGLLHALIDGKPLFYIQEGDLIGLRQGLNAAPCTYRSEEPLVLVSYDRESLFRHIHASNRRQELFTQYILGQAALMSDALARSKPAEVRPVTGFQHLDRKSTRLNSSHVRISYAVFCLKKKTHFRWYWSTDVNQLGLTAR